MRGMANEKLSIVHVVRPRPPWRSADHDLTECGISPAENASISRAEFVHRYRDLGRERTAMLTCMTCMTTFERYGGGRQIPATWEEDPVAALAREAEKVRWAGRKSEKRERLAVELSAIIQLIEEHQDEFDAIVSRLEWRSEQAKAQQSRVTMERARRK